MRKFKRTLKHKFKERMMKLLEMETALKIVASVANSRPLSARYGQQGGCDPDFLTPLTPNMMLTGRTNSEIPNRDYDCSSSPLVRLEYVQRVVIEWWEQFKIQNFTSLVPTQKWQQERRNMRVGDVVLVQYSSKSLPGTYRLARVIEVEVDQVDGLVHTCTVVYSLLAELKQADRAKYEGITKKELRVPVNRLVLILPVEEADGQIGGAAGLHGGELAHDDQGGDSRADGGGHAPTGPSAGEGLAQDGPEGGHAHTGHDEDSGKCNTACSNDFVKESYEWDDLGPGLVENGETGFIAVRRKETKVFDLVNLDWYRSDTVATSDPNSSSTDLWVHFKSLRGVVCTSCSH